THEAIEAVCNAKEDLNIDILEAIESLVDNSLIRRVGADLTEPRFVMLETMRDYALTRLREAGEEAYTRKAHAAYFVILAEEGEPATMGGDGVAEWFARYDAEIGNLRSALDWLIAAGEAEWSLRLFSSSRIYFRDRGLAEEAYDRSQRILSLPAIAPRGALRAKALQGAAETAASILRTPERIRYFKENSQIAEELNDLNGLLRALTHNAVADRSIGDYVAARSGFERAVEVARTIGNPNGLAGAISNLADLVKLQGEYELARLLQLEASRLFETAGDQTGVAWSLSHQADLAREQGNDERARSLYEDALG